MNILESIAHEIAFKMDVPYHVLAGWLADGIEWMIEDTISGDIGKNSIGIEIVNLDVLEKRLASETANR